MTLIYMPKLNLIILKTNIKPKKLRAQFQKLIA